MSAELLRQASTILRERAEDATPGPWDSEHHIGEEILVNAGTARTQWREVRGVRLGTAPSSWKSTDRILERGADDAFEEPEDIQQWAADADYIATMHPGVGLALANWLYAVAHNWDAQSTGLQADATDVARQILGSAS